MPNKKKYVASIEVVLQKEFHFDEEDLTAAYKHAAKIVEDTQWKNFFLAFELKEVIVTRVDDTDV